MRRRRNPTSGSTPAIAARAAASASAGARSIRTSTLRFINRTAAATTSTPTKSAAAESARRYPPRTSSSPTSTALEPSRSVVRTKKRLRPVSAGAENIEIRAERRCGLIRLVKQKGPPKRAFRRELRWFSAVCDVAVEDLVQERTGALALVLPVSEDQL